MLPPGGCCMGGCCIGGCCIGGCCIGGCWPACIAGGMPGPCIGGGPPCGGMPPIAGLAPDWFSAIGCWPDPAPSRVAPGNGVRGL